MSAIAQLKAMLGMDATKYKAGVQQAEASTKRFQNQLAGIGSAMAAAFSVAAIARATKSVIDFASEIRHTADNLDIGTDALQALNALALKSGVSIEQLTKGLTKIKDAQGNMKAGGEDAKRFVDAMEALKTSGDTFQNAELGKAFEQIGVALNNATDKEAAFAAIADILGEKVGPRMISMLKELGNDGLELVIEKTKTAGQLISDELITKLELLGTKNAQVILRMKVGWAGFIDILHKASASLGAQASVAADEIFGGRSLMSKLNPVTTALKTWKFLLTGGMGRAAGVGGKAIADIETPDVNLNNVVGAQFKPGGAAGGPTKAEADAIAKARTVLEELKRAQLEGLDKILADRTAMEADITKRMEGASKERIAILQEEMEVRRRAYDKDATQFLDAEDKKRNDALKAGESIQDVADRTPSVSSQGQSADSLARMGGFIGKSRGDLAGTDRKLQLSILARQLTAQEQAAKSLANIEAATPGKEVA